MKKTHIVLGILVASLISCKQNTPNFVLIMADDLGYNDLSCYGDVLFETPNIDRLARGGIKFTDYHSNGAVCSPTRAALMTGLYQQRTGIAGVVTAKNHRHIGLDPEAYTMADYFKERGYATAIIGKWHLGYDTAFSPINNGFDYFRGYVSGNVDYHSHIDQVGYFDWWLNKDTLVEEGYSTDLISEHSIDFIRDHKDEPFFLYIAHEAPHYPFQGRNDPPIRTINGGFNTQGARADKEAAYAEMIQAMDEGIGAVYACLEEEGLLENTLIFFCSDNGAAASHGSPSNYPLRGYKGNFWEGGHRVPAIAYWKGQIDKGSSDALLLSMDIFPTMIELIDGNLLVDRDFDGQSFFPILKDPDADFDSTRPVFWRFGDQKKAVRSGHWKYLEDKSGAYLLNLSSDLRETVNWVDYELEIRDSLKSLLSRWEKDMEQYEILTR